MSARDEILKFQPQPPRPLKIKGLSNGSAVCVRELSAREQNEFDEQQKGKVSREAYIALCLCQPDGLPVFTEADVGKLAEVNEKMVGTLYAACARVNGVREKDVEAALGN